MFVALARPSSMVASRVLSKLSGPQALLSSADFCRLKEGLHWGLQKDICQKYHVTNGLHDLAFGIPEWSFRQHSKAPQKRAVKSRPLQAALQVRVAGGTALGAARALARPRLQGPPAGPQALPEGRARGTGPESMWRMNGSVAQAREQLCLALSGSASFRPQPRDGRLWPSKADARLPPSRRRPEKAVEGFITSLFACERVQFRCRLEDAARFLSTVPTPPAAPTQSLRGFCPSALTA